MVLFSFYRWGNRGLETLHNSLALKAGKEHMLPVPQLGSRGPTLSE